MRNEKLAHIIASRTIREASSGGNALHFHFIDGSVMKINLVAAFGG
jgi:hypothetical protein